MQMKNIRKKNIFFDKLLVTDSNFSAVLYLPAVKRKKLTHVSACIQAVLSSFFSHKSIWRQVQIQVKVC